jgi:hypothetical protein
MTNRAVPRWTRRLALAVVAVAAAVVAAYVLFPADRSTAPLDRAPDTLVVPRYHDPVFFQGQGFPVRRALVSAGTQERDGARLHVLPLFDTAIAYKSTQETAEQVEHVNATYAPAPRWVFRPERRMGHYRCMATAASLVLDWFALRGGATLPEYTSLFDGRPYRGFDPKVLDAMYFERAVSEPKLFRLAVGSHADPVSGIPVPYSVAAYARLVEDATAHPGSRAVRDPQLPVTFEADFAPTGPLVAERVLGPTFQWRALLGVYPRTDSERLRRAIEERGPLLAGIKVRFSNLHGVFRDTRLGDLPIVGSSGHGVVIVGWIEKDDRLYFVYRETFGDCDEERVDCGPAYRIYPVYGFNEVFAFRPRPPGTA